MSFPRYERYKDSGVKWLGEVPAHWKVLKLARTFRAIGSGTTPQSASSEYYDGGDIPWVNTGDLNDGFVMDEPQRVTKAALRDYKSLRLHPTESVVIAMYGATIGKLGLLTFPSTVNQACCVLYDSLDIGNRYLFYWFLGLRQQIISMATGSGQPNISQNVIRTLQISCPSPLEQQSIANFLDLETMKIDALIEKQRRLIELLKEKRQAVISHAVTKGVDATVPMKDSATRWLGSIPENWEVVPLGYLVKFFSGGTPDKTNETYWDGSVPWVSPKDMKVEIISDSQDHVTEEAIDTGGLRLYREGHVLVVVRGMILAHTFPVAINAVPVTINQDMKALLCNKRITPEFLQTLMIGLNTPIVSLADVSAHGTLKLNSSVINDLAIVLPEVEEQQRILGWIRTQKSQLDRLSSQAERAVVLLQERRSALISAAVTGKIDVRNYNPKESK